MDSIMYEDVDTALDKSVAGGGGRLKFRHKSSAKHGRKVLLLTPTSAALFRLYRDVVRPALLSSTEHSIPEFFVGPTGRNRMLNVSASLDRMSKLAFPDAQWNRNRKITATLVRKLASTDAARRGESAAKSNNTFQAHSASTAQKHYQFISDEEKALTNYLSTRSHRPQFASPDDLTGIGSIPLLLTDASTPTRLLPIGYGSNASPFSFSHSDTAIQSPVETFGLFLSETLRLLSSLAGGTSSSIPVATRGTDFADKASSVSLTVSPAQSGIQTRKRARLAAAAITGQYISIYISIVYRHRYT